MPIGSLLRAIFPVILNALVVYLVLIAPRPRYIRVSLYSSLQIVIVFASNALLPRITRSQYIELFWTDDLLAHCFILLLILGLIEKAMAGRETTQTVVWGLSACVLVDALGSANAFQSPHLNQWMGPLSRNMSFCEEVLNFVLWGAIIQRRENDYLLFMVSAGIGVQVTGEVIGHTLRLYSHDHSTVWVPTMLVYLSEVLCLAIWIWAFYSARNSTQGTAAADGATGRLVDSGASRGSTTGA